MKAVVVAALAATFALPAFGDAQAGDAKAGKAFVQAACAKCHAVEAKGDSPNKKAPAFAKIAKSYSPEMLEEAFAEGIVVGHGTSDMPQFELEPADIDNLTAYLRTLRGPEKPKTKKAK